jgi:dipeptide/tripeptide permease
MRVSDFVNLRKRLALESVQVVVTALFMIACSLVFEVYGMWLGLILSAVGVAIALIIFTIIMTMQTAKPLIKALASADDSKTQEKLVKHIKQKTFMEPRPVILFAINWGLMNLAYMGFQFPSVIPTAAPYQEIWAQGASILATGVLLVILKFCTWFFSKSRMAALGSKAKSLKEKAKAKAAKAKAKAKSALGIAHKVGSDDENEEESGEEEGQEISGDESSDDE